MNQTQINQFHIFRYYIYITSKKVLYIYDKKVFYY
jgi:hypothetical protein